MKTKTSEITKLNSSRKLLMAAQTGNLTMAKVALEKGADVNYIQIHDQTPLMFAASKGHLGITRLLLRNGAKVNVRDEEGFTPLMFSAMGSSAAITKLLLEKGAEKDARDNRGFTPLMHAFIAAKLHSAIALIEAGADINLINVEGKRAENYAVSPRFITALLRPRDPSQEQRQKMALVRSGAIEEILDELERDKKDNRKG
ncbi:MAG: ankyrin repeat domain-containing protein [Candidatus Micrarchaeota archaeon]|nr:ankyrin repeat domain-containing protein [Candidatus Micrarchaeota archaeon]